MSDGSSARELVAAFAAAAGWWREAGIDTGFADAPHNWLEAEKLPAPPPNTATKRPSAGQRPATPSPAPPAQIGGDRAHWPADLGAFADWWLGEPTLAAAGGGHRVRPRGPRGAPLMVLAPEPEAADRERLLAGPQGRLLSAILAALGIAEDAAYVASALPAHVGLADWDTLRTRGLGDVLIHHLVLAAPERLLVFGREPISPLLGHGPAHAGATLTLSGAERRMIPVAYATTLQGLLERPARKAQVWRMLLEWTA